MLYYTIRTQKYVFRSRKPIFDKSVPQAPSAQPPGMEYFMNDRQHRPRPDRGDTAPDGIIEGRNAVIEALRAGVDIDKIFIMKGEVDTALGQ